MAGMDKQQRPAKPRQKKSGKQVSSSNPLMEEIKRYHAKKRFSQNFLINQTVLDAIRDSLDLSASDQVIEIGSGTGFLTRGLIEKAGAVTAIEVERDMQRKLREQFENNSKFTLLEEDVLKTDLLSLIQSDKAKVVGNLPYSITSPILFKLAGELYQKEYPLREKIDCATVMVQKEVADRIVASSGEKAYNPLTISLQWWFDAEKICDVPRESFYPAPKVMSSVVKLTPKDQPAYEVLDYKMLHQVVKAAFHQKRRTLRNTLCHAFVKHGNDVECIQKQLNESDILAMLEEAGIDPGLRAEKISLQAFGKLSDVFTRNTRQS